MKNSGRGKKINRKYTQFLTLKKLNIMEFIINDDVFFKLKYLDKFMANHKGYIAGGCFKNLFENKPIKDIDIFFESESDFNEAKKYFKKSKDFKKAYCNKKVDAFKHKKTSIIIELVNHLFFSPKEMILKFDFSITRFAYYKDKKEGNYTMIYSDKYFEHLVNKKLVIDGELLYPVSTFERSYRYKKYGFGLCMESKEKLLAELSDANLDDLSNDLYFGVD